ncbi:MAG: serine/threonine protein kinase [Planctomycetes bacterium]|nr:serine/threonine protein kinase [Planctomycetota bacterium]
MTIPVMLVGSVLNGYRVIGKLAELPETILYKGVHEQNLHEVIIKMLLPHVARKRELIRQLRREAYYEGRLNHPNIIKGRGFFRSPVRHHFIMDYFPSKSMRSRLMDEDDSIVGTYRKKIMIEVGTALAYAHRQGLVHRDIKPENILINSAGDAKVIDFALASRYDFISRILIRRRIQGTHSYMAPEQIRGDAVDNRADIYSYGATVFEMIVGHPPFTGASEAEILRRHLNEPVRPLRQFTRNVTAAFDALVTRMLAKSPSDRPDSMKQVVATLKEIDLFLDEGDTEIGETGVQDE